jgi:hypothetical protein
MRDYEDTLKDIKNTLGIIPNFCMSLPKEILIQDWRIWKKYIHGNTAIPEKYRTPRGVYGNKWLNILMMWMKGGF